MIVSSIPYANGTFLMVENHCIIIINNMDTTVSVYHFYGNQSLHHTSVVYEYQISDIKYQYISISCMTSSLLSCDQWLPW